MVCDLANCTLQSSLTHMAIAGFVAFFIRSICFVLSLDVLTFSVIFIFCSALIWVPFRERNALSSRGREWERVEYISMHLHCMQFFSLFFAFRVVQTMRQVTIISFTSSSSRLCVCVCVSFFLFLVLFCVIWLFRNFVAFFLSRSDFAFLSLFHFCFTSCRCRLRRQRCLFSRCFVLVHVCCLNQLARARSISCCVLVWLTVTFIEIWFRFYAMALARGCYVNRTHGSSLRREMSRTNIAVFGYLVTLSPCVSTENALTRM